MRRLIAILCLSLMLVGLYGCGNKGDLVLTEEEKKEKTQRSGSSY